MDSTATNNPSAPVKQYLEQNLPVLESDTRRHTFTYLSENQEASLEEIVEALSSDLLMEEEKLETRLYHSDIPKLEEQGLVGYDPETEYVELTENGKELRDWMEELEMLEE